ncbi:MAG: hypothetical protein IJ068_07065 [Bacilli bacterium]|nr:hypothetical protein [Bacilli bacterium]
MNSWFSWYKIKKIGVKNVWEEIKKDKKNLIFIVYIPIFLLLIPHFLPQIDLPDVKEFDINKFEQIMNKNECYIDNIDGDKEQTYVVNESSQCLYNIQLIKYSSIEEATEKFNNMEKDIIGTTSRNKSRYVTDTYNDFYEYTFETNTTAVLTQNRNVLLYAKTSKVSNKEFYNMLYEIGGHYKLNFLLSKQFLIIYFICFIMFVDVIYILIFNYTKISKMYEEVIKNKDNN